MAESGSPTTTMEPGGAQATGRKRVRKACEPCKSRKKRCDGNRPCATCVRYEYECVYHSSPRKRQKHDSESSEMIRTASTEPPSVAPTPNHPNVEPSRAQLPMQIEPREALSGTALASVLTTKLNSDGSSSQRPLSWNLGAENEPSALALNLTSILTQDEMNRLANSYFTTVHKCFGFISEELFRSKLAERWSRFDLPDPSDIIFCGVAALGSLFEVGALNRLQASLVECAKVFLEAPKAVARPSRTQVAGWQLRTHYLRCMASPHAAWLASCTTMHTIETVEAAEEDPSLGAGAFVDMLRLKWLASLLNNFISNEYGRTKQQPAVDVSQLPQSVPGDYTINLLRVYQVSAQTLFVAGTTASDLEAAIAKIAAWNPGHDVVALSQANLTCALYRRLRVLETDIPPQTREQILSIGGLGLTAVKNLARKRQPWWHVVNLPFQVICTLLVMDSKDSLNRLAEAMETLQVVAQAFPSSSISEATKMARQLVRLSRRQKHEEVVLLDRALTVDSDPRYDELTAAGIEGDQRPAAPKPNIFTNVPSPNITLSDFEDFDWNSLMSTDLPLF